MKYKQNIIAGSKYKNRVDNVCLTFFSGSRQDFCSFWLRKKLLIAPRHIGLRSITRHSPLKITVKTNINPEQANPFK